MFFLTTAAVARVMPRISIIADHQQWHMRYAWTIIIASLRAPVGGSAQTSSAAISASARGP
jgi:hypothetical protein